MNGWEMGGWIGRGNLKALLLTSNDLYEWMDLLFHGSQCYYKIFIVLRLIKQLSSHFPNACIRYKHSCVSQISRHLLEQIPEVNLLRGESFLLDHVLEVLDAVGCLCCFEA